MLLVFLLSYFVSCMFQEIFGMSITKTAQKAHGSKVHVDNSNSEENSATKEVQDNSKNVELL